MLYMPGTFNGRVSRCCHIEMGSSENFENVESTLYLTSGSMPLTELLKEVRNDVSGK